MAEGRRQSLSNDGTQVVGNRTVKVTRARDEVGEVLLAIRVLEETDEGAPSFLKFAVTIGANGMAKIRVGVLRVGGAVHACLGAAGDKASECENWRRETSHA